MKYKLLIFSLAAGLIGFAQTGHAQTLTIQVNNIQTTEGMVGCALFDGPDGYPMKAENARSMQVEPTIESVMCQFDNVSPGIYAASVSHDINGNGEIDTNFLGIPREAWGVSNNVRPPFRAPEFEEAQFEMRGDNKTIEITID
tara:strand:+ start:695 stop:1123 length:429 start_codon:yes stop_codon:yes gene_type:complete